MISFSITLAVAILGVFVASRLKIPAAFLIGSLFAVALYNSCTSAAFFPPHLKVFSTSLVGCYIGCRVSRKDIQELKKLWWPAILTIFAMLGYNILGSLFLCNTTGISGRTAILAFAPAGVTDMSLVSLDMGADTAVVSTTQILRLITVVSLSPFLIQKSIAFFGACTSLADRQAHAVAPTEKKSASRQELLPRNVDEWKRTALTLLVGVPAGLIGKASGFPAGTLCFSIVATLILNFTTDKVFMPRAFRRTAQILSGALIGVQFSPVNILNLRNDLSFILMVTAGWLVLNQILGIFLHKSTGLSMETAFFASAAGGMTDLGFIALEMGADPMQLLTIQLARQLSVLLFYPILVQLLVSMHVIG